MTPTANKLVFAAVWLTDANGIVEPLATSITGCNLTWTNIAIVLDTSLTNSCCLWTGYGASPTTDVPVITVQPVDVSLERAAFIQFTGSTTVGNIQSFTQPAGVPTNVAFIVMNYQQPSSSLFTMAILNQNGSAQLTPTNGITAIPGTSGAQGVTDEQSRFVMWASTFNDPKINTPAYSWLEGTYIAAMLGVELLTSSSPSPSLISQAPVLFAPTFRHQIRGSLISANSRTFAPTVLQVNKVVPDLISQAGTTFAPTIGTIAPVQAPMIPSAWGDAWGSIPWGGRPYVFEPQVTMSVSTSFISQAPVLFAPSIGRKTVSPDFLLDYQGNAFDPAVTLRVAPELIDQSPVLFNTEQITGAFTEVDPDLIDQAGVVFAPSVAPKTVRPPTINLNAHPIPPAVTQQAVPSFLDQAGVLFAPAVVTTGFSPLPSLIDQAAVTFAPAIVQKLAPALISQAGVLFAPNVNVQQLFTLIIDQMGTVLRPEVVLAPLPNIVGDAHGHVIVSHRARGTTIAVHHARGEVLDE